MLFVTINANSMIAQVKKLLSKEIISFQRLSPQAQRLIFAIFLYNVTFPILFLFVSAFLWRETTDMQAVAIYFLVNYIGLPVGFYINGFLLRKFSPQQLFLFGNLSRGLSVVLLIFVPHITYGSIIFFGLVSGVSGGFHFANRNYITIRLTNSNNRIYFSTLDNASSIITSVFIPLFVGWFITFGKQVNWYSPLLAYKIVAIFALILLCFSGVIIQKLSIEIEPITQLLFFKASHSWTKLRLFNIFHGLLNGMIVLLPALITLLFLGNEEILGTTQSYMAILSAIVLYFVGKKIQVTQRLKMLCISLVVIGLGSLLFGLFFSVIGVLCYLTLEAFGDPFNEVCFISITYDAMDREESKNKKHHYSYLLDQEIFHNIGRALGISLFILFMNIFSRTFAIRFTPVILALSQISLLFLFKSIKKNNKRPLSTTHNNVS